MPTRNLVTPILDDQSNNVTRTHLSTNILIKVEGNPVNALQEFSYDEARDIKFWSQIGSDGQIDSAPSRSATIGGSIKRMRYNRARITEALSRCFIHIHAQRLPFDIEIQDIFHDGNPSNAIITTIQNVWIKSQRVNYSSSDFLIVEDVNWEAERIFSILNNKNVVQSVANGNSNPIILNTYEQEADRGAFTGSIDALGLLNAFQTDPRN